jgi:hypothetical protein
MGTINRHDVDEEMDHGNGNGNGSMPALVWKRCGGTDLIRIDDSGNQKSGARGYLVVSKMY